MYWPVGTPRIYQIAELHSHIKSLETNNRQKKIPSEGLSPSENENLGKALDADAQLSIGVCDHSSKDKICYLSASNILSFHDRMLYLEMETAMWTNTKRLLPFQLLRKDTSSLH